MTKGTTATVHTVAGASRDFVFWEGARTHSVPRAVLNQAMRFIAKRLK